MRQNREPGRMSTRVRLVPLEANSGQEFERMLFIWEAWGSEIGREVVPTGWRGKLREVSQLQQCTVELFPCRSSMKRYKPCFRIISPEE